MERWLCFISLLHGLCLRTQVESANIYRTDIFWAGHNKFGDLIVFTACASSFLVIRKSGELFRFCGLAYSWDLAMLELERGRGEPTIGVSWVEFVEKFTNATVPEDAVHIDHIEEFILE